MATPYKKDSLLLRFAQEYHSGKSAKQSAMAAGWSERTAHGSAFKLLENNCVKKHLARMQEETKKKFDLSEEKIINELSKIAFANIANYISYDEQGEVKFKPSIELSKDETAAISEMSNSKKFGPNGEQLGVDVKFKMNDKIKALDKLGQKLGMWTDNIKIEKRVITVQIDDDEE